jgi:hypothetical protein
MYEDLQLLHIKEGAVSVATSPTILWTVQFLIGSSCLPFSSCPYPVAPIISGTLHSHILSVPTLHASSLLHVRHRFFLSPSRGPVSCVVTHMCLPSVFHCTKYEFCSVIFLLICFTVRTPCFCFSPSPLQCSSDHGLVSCFAYFLLM